MSDVRLDSEYASGLAPAAYELKHIFYVNVGEYFNTCKSIIY